MNQEDLFFNCLGEGTGREKNVLSHPRLGNRPDGISIRHKFVLEDHLGAVVVEGANLKTTNLRWKSQRIK
jgi:hypothetical protein